MNERDLKEAIFHIRDEHDFNDLALEIFRFQYKTNKIYREFTDRLRMNPKHVNSYDRIPFMPIQFFRDHKILSGSSEHFGKIFSSSGTTGSRPGRHYIKELSLYEDSFTKGFDLFYGSPANYGFFFLLPGYTDRPDSSLIFMAENLVSRSLHNGSGFYLQNREELVRRLEEMNRKGNPVILFGVSYALLDLAETFKTHIPRVIVMETGGMKGHGRELIREEFHGIICSSFGIREVHSEYGMTELLSQAYSKGNGIFQTPPWLKILIRDINDPLSLLGNNKTGGINAIDLANLYSCSFIATQDLGITHEEGSFEVLGRFDDSDVRGCNLLFQGF
jgi:phenylacetate-coenzyme A ligase PaaK-like adenylate-forming protein